MRMSHCTEVMRIIHSRMVWVLCVVSVKIVKYVIIAPHSLDSGKVACYHRSHAKYVIDFKMSGGRRAWTIAMVARGREVDDLDLLLRDVLRDATMAQVDSQQVWSRLAIRLAGAPSARRWLHMPDLARADFPSPKWTLNCHLMSLARVIC
jgi:hypothetical protein